MSVRYAGERGSASLHRLDDLFLRIAARYGAVEQQYSCSMSRAMLEKFDYFVSFPGRAVQIDGSANAFVPPALCYFVYDQLRGETLSAPVLVTTCGTCARNETEYREPFRLRTFTMREIIFLGSRVQVEHLRQQLLRRTAAVAQRHGLAARVEFATDPFFVSLDTGRGRQLLQRLKALKHELVIDSAGGEQVALASFNHHEDFFGRRMGIRLADGSFAHSGCVAFGLERWAAALGH